MTDPRLQRNHFLRLELNHLIIWFPEKQRHTHTLHLLIMQCAILGHQTDKTYRDPKTYFYGAVEDYIHILESQYGNLTNKVGIGQKFGGQK